MADLGIQCIDSLGFLGFAVLVVFSAHVDRPGPSTPSREGRRTASSTSRCCSTLPCRSSPYSQSAHIRSANCLPALLFAADELLPDRDPFGASHDVPIHFYRRQRVLRAIGAIPSDRILPPPMSPARPPPSPAGARRGQFTGDVAVTTWNAQALFATDVFRFTAKSSYVGQLMRKSDICLITEAHGSETGNDTWRPPDGTTCWWSTSSSLGMAGVGVVVKDDFLRQFSARPKWVHIWRGRAAKLCLRGPLGSLDIVVIYGHAGNHRVPEDADLDGVPRARRHAVHSYFDLRSLLRDKIGASLASPDDCLTILGGDFNYVVDSKDRVSLGT